MVIRPPMSDGGMLKIKDRLRNNILPFAMGLFDVTADEIGGVRVITHANLPRP